MELFFDTETTGLALFKEPYTHEKQPDIIQIGIVLSDAEKIYFKLSTLVIPENSAWNIGKDTEKIHGISNEMVLSGGILASTVESIFRELLSKANIVVAHNIDFDRKLMQVMLHRLKKQNTLDIFNAKSPYCTMKEGTRLCKLPGPYGYKWPKLVELYKHLFNETFEGAHDALNDVLATRRCYYEMVKK